MRKALSLLPDKDMEITETIVEPVRALNRAWEMIRSARNEILVLFSSSIAFDRQDRAGSLQLFKEVCSKTKTLQTDPNLNHTTSTKNSFKNFHRPKSPSVSWIESGPLL